MAKRSDFLRLTKDKYRTWDPRAVCALLPHLAPRTIFVEPCAGDGVLLDQLVAAGHVCADASDIEPEREDIGQADALETRWDGAQMFVTNPPWTRKILHPLIVHLSDQAPVWMLFDADWIQTKQAIPYLPRLRKIVAVGRVRWIPDTKHDGKDNCAWYLLTRPSLQPAQFFGRLSTGVSPPGDNGATTTSGA